MIKFNKDKLVMIAVQGEVTHPRSRRSPYRIDTKTGTPKVLPGTGGITYNKKIGDVCTGFQADHVEPGVTLKLKDENENGGLNVLACVGNTAKVVSGDAKGETGYVTGKHGGAEHVMVYFPEETLEKMIIGDKVLIKSYGTGLEIDGFEDVLVMNTDPELFEKLNIKVNDDGVLEIPVATEVPAYLMGSGIGSSNAYRGDYDIMTADPKAYKEFGLDKLRFGDIVLLHDCNTTTGRGYLEGAVTIGVVIHSDCILTGHGPGITTLMTSKKPLIEGIKDANANIANYLEVN